MNIKKTCTKNSGFKNLLTQAINFIGISGLGWLLDLGTYTALSYILKSLELSNMISSWVGVTFVFIFATRKVFQSEGKMPLWARYLIYLLYQVALIYFISKALLTVNAFILNNVQIEVLKNVSPLISKIAITPVTILLNFLFMKCVIEKL